MLAIMPVIDPYAGTPEEFTENMWKEYVANWRTGGESIFNKRSGEASLSGHIPAAVIKAAMRFALGYEQIMLANFSGVGSGFVLCRRNPIRHPYYEQLWCTGVGEQEFKPITDYVPGAGRRLKLGTNPVPVKTPAAIANRTGYAKCKLMLRFAPVEYDVREDDDSRDPNISIQRAEYKRNLFVDVQPRAETFETKITWKYAEGVGIPAGIGYTNPFGTPALAERAQVLVKPDVTLQWRDVPSRWLLAPGTFLPANLLTGLGCVNFSVFRGFIRGTLLLTGVKITRYPWALRPRDDLNPGDRESPFLFDVELMCSHFDPVKGFTGNPPVQITTERGHNNFPYRGSVVALPFGIGTIADGNSQMWFLATVTGTEDGARLYNYIDFERLFDSPLNFKPYNPAGFEPFVPLRR